MNPVKDKLSENDKHESELQILQSPGPGAASGHYVEDSGDSVARHVMDTIRNPANEDIEDDSVEDMYHNQPQNETQDTKTANTAGERDKSQNIKNHSKRKGSDEDMYDDPPQNIDTPGTTVAGNIIDTKRDSE